MKIANVLTTKGRPVITVRPTQTVRAAVTLLAEQVVGALVIDEGGPSLEFGANEQGGKLYVVMSHGFGTYVPAQKCDVVKACMAAEGVDLAWAFLRA